MTWQPSEYNKYFSKMGEDGLLLPQKLYIWEDDFSTLVQRTYGRPYRLQQQEPMMGQDECWLFSLPQQPDPFNWTGTSFEEWRDADTTIPEGEEVWKWELRWEREFYPDRYAVVADLHARGLLPAGDYIMHVWW